MSPEQVRGEPLDGRSDLFSLGLVLYEMAAGRPAFPGRTSGVIFDGILNRAPETLRTVQSAFPAALERILTKLLEKDPGRRYESAAELVDDLARARSGEEVPAADAPPAIAALPRTLGVRHGMSPAVWATIITVTSVALGTAVATIAAVVLKGPEASDLQRQLAWISSVVFVASSGLGLLLRRRSLSRSEASSGSVRVVKVEQDARAELHQRRVRRGLLWGTIVLMMAATVRSLLQLRGGFDRGDLLAAIMTGSFGAYLLYMERKSRSGTGAWWESGCAHRTVEIEATETHIASRCEKALLQLGAQVTALDPEAGVLEAQTAPGWRSWGERMRVQIHGSGEGRFRVEIWSENEANVRKILDTLLT
jgi:hypothetical protein